MVARAPIGRSPVQTSWGEENTAVPTLDAAPAKSASSSTPDRAAVIVAPGRSTWPWLVTVTVKSTAPPAGTIVAEATFVMSRSATGVLVWHGAVWVHVLPVAGEVTELMRTWSPAGFDETTIE